MSTDKTAPNSYETQNAKRKKTLTDMTVVLNDANTFLRIDNSNESNVIIVNPLEMKEWCCDVCNVAVFQTYEEAVAHEAICGQLIQQQQQHTEQQIIQQTPLTRKKEDCGRLDITEWVKNDAVNTNNDSEKQMASNNDSKNIWICDVCKVASFATWEEADRHESKCNINCFEVCGNDAVSRNTDNINTNHITLYIDETKQSWSCAICKDAKFESFEEAITHEKACTGVVINEKQKISRQMSYSQDSNQSSVVVDMCDTDDEDEDEVSIFSSRRQGERGQNTKSSGKKLSKVQNPKLLEDGRTKAKRNSTKRSAHKGRTTKNAPVASIFLSGSNGKTTPRHLLEELNILEFKAKRRAMEERERERQEKRAQSMKEKQKQNCGHNLDDQPNTVLTSTLGFFSLRKPSLNGNKRARVDTKIYNDKQIAGNLDTLETVCAISSPHRCSPKRNGTKHPASVGLPLFPNPFPSHLVPRTNDGGSKYQTTESNLQQPWLTQEQINNIVVQQNTCSTYHFVEQLDVHDINDSDNYSFVDSTLPTEGIGFEPYLFTDKSQLLDIALKSQIVRTKKEDTKYTTKKYAELVPSLTWVDKYLAIKDIDTDTCGKSLNQIANDLEMFIEQWKIERQKSNAKMLERQQKLKEKFQIGKKERKLNKLKQSKAKYKDDDDFLWEDDDESLSDGADKLHNLYLLHGPVGCGKTAIVHAVAKKHQCKVLEINTTQQRGQSGLKKILLEATQSLSSIEMLKKQKLRDTAAFFSTSDTSRGILSDSDSETETPKKQDSDLGFLTVVLIDEIDLLFDDDGDSGFFQALNEVSKSAKCPIIMTCNVYPKQSTEHTS
jgi:ATPase family associated with various cellular activities (AAA)